MKRNTIAIVFELEKRNFYSLTPLISTIDNSPKLKQIDQILMQDISPRDIKLLLKKYEQLIIGLSFRTAQIEKIYVKMCEFYKRLTKNDLERIIFIAGGSHASGSPETTLRLGFNYTFIGEAEYSLVFFLEEIVEKLDPKVTPGIAYYDDNCNQVIKTANPPLIKLDDYPFLSKKRKLFPPLEISRGCTFSCAFCQVPQMFHHRIRHRSPHIIIDTVKWMALHNLYDIRFITPNSFGYMSLKPRETNIQSILHLLSSIHSIKGIRSVYFGTFPGEVRPETVSEELVGSIKPFIANKRISIGLQSGSDRVLKHIQRGHSVEEGLQAIKILVDFGFTPVVDLIFGLPQATLEDEYLSIDIINQLTKKGVLFRAHVFMPLPGTKFENIQFKPVFPKIRKILGSLSTKGVIEGAWSHQEKYAESTWKTINKIINLPPIRK
ncbi:MAG: TIGR04013 family B12-binding domain/radical SAM domain-containing protein [Candidatus Heimdallarchaeaceae archaeon]